MKLHWPSKNALISAALALPGTLLPQDAGISLYNTYWKLGWPFPIEVTLYGPNSGYWGMSMPFLPVIFCNFAFWFVVAMLSLRIWSYTNNSSTSTARALSAGAVCAVWGLIFTCFIAATAKFLLDGLWLGVCLTNRDVVLGQLTMTAVVRVYPSFCVGLFSLPFVVQFIMSRRYRAWRRVAFCGVSVLFLGGLASPLAECLPDMLRENMVPVLRPVAYCQYYYTKYLGVTDLIGQRNTVQESKLKGQLPTDADGAIDKALNHLGAK